MIIKGKQPTALKEIPFLANFEGDEDEAQKIFFSEGKIFECFNSLSQFTDEEQDFSHGAYFYKPTNMDEKFDYEDGDQFYLRLDKENSSIVKTDDPEDGDILIWKDDSQFLSENVFLQEAAKQFSFTPTLLEIKEDGSKRYRMNGGSVCIFNEGIIKNIDSFEYTLQSGEERFYYVEIDVRITELSQPDTIASANRNYINDYEVVEIKVIHRDEKITDEERENSQAYILGNQCANTEGQSEEERLRGKYWVDLPANGNINLKVEVTNAPTVLVKALLRNFTVDEELVVGSLTYSAIVDTSDLPHPTCVRALPQTLRIFNHFIEIGMPPNFQDKFEVFTVSSTLSHKGNGVYGPKTITIPDNVNLLTSDGGDLIVRVDNKCSSFAQFGKYAEVDITGVKNKKTSFITVAPL